MKKVIPAILLLVLATSIVGRTAVSETDKPASPQKVVVHLSHFTDDLHRCFMALKLGTLLQKSGAEVHLFLDLEGVRLAERRQLLDMTWGSSETTLAQHYENFTEGGGKVLLCPHCASSARIGDMSLKRHAEIGNDKMIATMFLETDKILDY